MTNYQIGDFLIRLKNAGLAGIKEVRFPVSKMVLGLAKALKEEGFISSLEKDKNYLIVGLAIYNKKPVLSDVKIVSRPGLRIYMDVKGLAAYKKPEILILTTPKGIMSSKKAIKEKVGGEVLVKII